MSTLLSRMVSIFRSVQPRMNVGPAYNFVSNLSDSKRADLYKRNKARYDNSYYDAKALNGYREEVLKNFNLDDDVLLGGVYNPINEIVDSYQNIFRGRWGHEIRVAEKVGGDDGRDVNQLLTPKGDDIIGKIWRMSNFGTKKQPLQEIAANYGTVGIRIAVRPANKVEDRRVFLQVHHPGEIEDFDEDDRGNITAVRLRYMAEEGDFGEREQVEYIEELSKSSFTMQRGESTPLQVENVLGLCPFVLLRHRDRGEKWGEHAYKGSEQIVDALNVLFSNVTESVQDHIWATWFATAAGEEPKDVQVGRHRFVYTQVTGDQSVAPDLKPLVANLDFGGAVNLGVTLIDALVSRSPELLLTHIKALAGQSGETIAKLQTSAIAKIEAAGDNYEDAVIRAFKIAMSWGVYFDMWDLGAGTGTIDAANASFLKGLEDFEFMPRPTLPETVFDKLNRAKVTQAEGMAKAEVAAKYTGILPVDEQIRLSGVKDPEQRKKLREQLIQDQKDGLIKGQPQAGGNPTGSGPQGAHTVVNPQGS